MKPFRVRLKFDDSALTDSQKSAGLKRSWVLVSPEHRTISDLSSYLLQAFNLLDSCPYGIFLSVDEFALPHFESTSILNSTDLVSVNRKGSKLFLEQKADKKLPLSLGKPVSVNEDFEKKDGGFQSESEETDEDVQTDSFDEENVPNGDMSTRKRKASKQLKNSKKKSKHSDSCLQNGCYQKKSANSKQDQVHNQLCNNTDNWEGIVCLSSDPDETVEASALCKKKSHGKGLEYEDHLKISDKESDSGDEVVPVVIRPGHIRFTTPGKGKNVQQYQGAKEPLNLCEIKNDKKWGKKKQNYDQKQPSTKWNKFRAAQDKQPTSAWNENRPPQEMQPANTWGKNSSWSTKFSGSTGMNKASTSTSENGSKDMWEQMIVAKSAEKADTSGKSTNCTSEDCSKDVWEEVSAAVIAKKAESLKEDSWNTRKRKPANYNWSYRTFRSRALGLNMPDLRAQNGRGGAGDGGGGGSA